MNESRVLVVGATGQLGGVIARKLMASGARVRALARNRDALASLGPAAEIAAVDLRDVPKLTEACRGVEQIVATANNNMGKGALSPSRVDLSGYQNLCAAARNTGVRRLIYVCTAASRRTRRSTSFASSGTSRMPSAAAACRTSCFGQPRSWTSGSIRSSPRAFATKGVAMIFGDGTSVANYIAVDDVAEFAVKILARPEIVNEAVDAGGPSNLSQNDLATLVERRLHVLGQAPAHPGRGPAPVAAGYPPFQ